MKQTIVVWVAVILMISCLLFPPYGYDRFPNDSPSAPWVSTTWRYVTNRFLFAPDFDQLRREGIKVGELDIGWDIVAVECAVIVLVAGGLLFTLREKRKDSAAT
jgi:hypothetical protein